MGKRWLIPVIVVALLLIATGYWGYQQYQDKTQLQTYLGNRYKESFYNLVGRVEDMTLLLGKSIASNSQEQFVSQLSDCWRQSFAAQEVLNQLPISNATLMNTSKFLTQVGDYCKAISNQNLRERIIPEEQRKKLISLRKQASDLSEVLHNLEARVNKGTVTLNQIVRGSRRAIDNEDKNLIGNNLQDMVESNEPFPTLIYDGPFSDHIDQQKPVGITGNDISKEKAREICSDFADFQGDPNLVVKDLTDVKGKIPAYQFSIQPDGNNKNHITCDVTKKGGHVVMYLNPRNVGEKKISRVEALDKMNNFLKERGYSDMVPTYSWIEDNTMTTSFAAKQDDVIMYPDLIKCKSALDNGQIIGFEALGYLMSNKKRDLVEPKVTKEEVKGLLDERCEVESIRQCVIPTASKSEKQCWEARCRLEDEIYLFYYDVNTGDEINILKLIDTPEGTFTE